MTRGRLPSYVLDSYALLAWLQDEPGGSVVGDLLRQAAQSSVALNLCLINLGEILYITEREQSIQSAHRALAIINDLPIQQACATRELTFIAAHYKARYRMSYADCFALALSRQLGATLVTGDPELQMQDDVKILWVG